VEKPVEKCGSVATTMFNTRSFKVLTPPTYPIYTKKASFGDASGQFMNWM